MYLFKKSLLLLLATSLFAGACATDELSDQESCAELFDFLAQCEDFEECDTPEIREETEFCQGLAGDKADEWYRFDDVELRRSHQTHYEAGSCETLQENYWLHGNSVSHNELIRIQNAGASIPLNNYQSGVLVDNDSYQISNSAYPNISYAYSYAEILKTADPRSGQILLHVTLERNLATTYNSFDAPWGSCDFNIEAHEKRYFTCVADNCTIYWYGPGNS